MEVRSIYARAAERRMIMAKRQIQFTKTCSDCIHESACRIWTDGRFISDASASVCPNHETVKESSAYLCGVLDERKRRQTNADRIRAMSDEELAEFIKNIKVRAALCKAVKNNDAFEELCSAEWLQQPAEGGE